jgi:putative ABC transport system permease protein
MVYAQLDFIRKMDLGFSKDQIVIVSTNLPETRQRFETVKSQLLADPSIVKASFTSNRPGGSDWGLPIEIEGRDESADNDFAGFRVLNVDWDFLDTYEIELAAGRGFSRDYPADTTTWIINQTAAKQLGWTLETARRIGAPKVSRPFADVIGIVKDFHFHSTHEEIGPLLIMMTPGWLNTFSIKTAAGRTDEAMEHIESVMARWEPQFPLTYQFFDEQFDGLHEAEQRVGSLLTSFAILAIFIACLGLFGLASFTAAQRTKEIGVRKVLGARIATIVADLSSDIARLVMIGVVVAVPPAWYAMDRWLADFAYGPGITWHVFAVSGLLMLAIAMLTVSYQSLRAALLDPVDALRYE